MPDGDALPPPEDASSAVPATKEPVLAKDMFLVNATGVVLGLAVATGIYVFTCRGGLWLLRQVFANP